ncbi:MAG: DUF87 domain-containing protein [Clostridia bacterium]|nr:DUF87 domain-containing protein [Clostridia bacterium]
MNPDRLNAVSRKNEVIGVILIGLGALCSVSVYFGVASVFGALVKNILFGLGGVLGYLVPVLLILYGGLWIAAKRKVLNRSKQLLLLLVLFLIFTLCHLAVTAQIYVIGQSYGTFLADSYTVGAFDRSGGGLLGALPAYWLYRLFGTVGSWIACICGIVACLIVLTNLSLRQLSSEIGTAVKSGYRDFAAKSGERRLERERSRKQQHEENLYVESLRAEKDAARKAQNDPFDLRIQSFEPKSRAGRRKRPRPKPALAAGSALDLRVFEPREKPGQDGGYRVETASVAAADEPEFDLSPYREVFREEGIEFDKEPVLETRGRRRIEPPAEKEEDRLPWDDVPPGGLRAEKRPDEPPGEARSAALSLSLDPAPGPPAEKEEDHLPWDDVPPGGLRAVKRPDELSGESRPGAVRTAPQPAPGPPAAAGQSDTVQSAPYHVETGQHRAGTAAVIAAAEDGGPAPSAGGSYVFPPLDLLDAPAPGTAKSREEVQRNARRLEETLASFRIEAHVVDILQGPVVTRYELQPAPGIKVSKIVQLADDIALNLAAKSIRIEAPVPGKSVIGIEVPNAKRDTVGLRELLADPKFAGMKSPVAFALGKDITGTNVFADIAKMPHLLIAGQTGSGKSVCVNSLIVSLLYHASPDDVNLLMIDPKVVELSVFNNIPHLVAPVVTDPKKASMALNWGVAEMENRYRDFAKRNVKELRRYNEVLQADGEKKLPHVVVIVDELADLMMTSGPEVEEAITRIAQKGRAAGIHLVLATQRPTVDVVTGLIKANVPARVALSVKASRDSQIILDTVGAEKLLGYGDMLFYTTGLPNPERIQGCWVSDKEVEKVAEFLYTPPEKLYNAAVQESIENGAAQTDGPGDDRDALFLRAVDTVLENEQASTSLLQRRLKVGYARAARLIDQLEREGIVSGQNGSKPRQVLITREEFENMSGGDLPD